MLAPVSVARHALIDGVSAIDANRLSLNYVNDRIDNQNAVPVTKHRAERDVLGAVDVVLERRQRARCALAQRSDCADKSVRLPNRAPRPQTIGTGGDRRGTRH